MTTILDALGGALATVVIAAVGVAQGPSLADMGRDAVDRHIAGAQVQQIAVELGAQVTKADTLNLGAGPAVTSLTCATEKCTSFVELEGFKLSKGMGDVVLTRAKNGSFKVAVTTPRGSTTATYTSGTGRTVVEQRERSETQPDTKSITEQADSPAHWADHDRTY